MEKGGAAVGISETEDFFRQIDVRRTGVFPWPAVLMEDNAVSDEGGVGELGLEFLDFSHRVDDNTMGHIIIKGALVFDDEDEPEVRESAELDDINDVGPEALAGGGFHFVGKRGEGMPIDGVDERLWKIGFEE